jgi:chromate reductase
MLTLVAAVRQRWAGVVRVSSDVAVIVGSLRKNSLTRKTAGVLQDLAPSGMRLEIVEIGKLPLYNQDEEASPPQAWKVFRERVGRAQAVLFVTPEYNRSLPGSIKNALDVGSRPYGESVWDGKPAAVVSVSPGALGAFGANHHLRQSLVFLNMPVLQQPEVYLGRISELLDKEGNLVSESTREFLSGFMEAFQTWIETVSHKLANATAS